MRSSPFATFCALVLLAAALGAGACQPSSGAPGAQAGGNGGEVDLAPMMAEFQRHSQKLGFAIAAHNQKLARFYVKEIGETLAEVEKVKQAEWVPIGQTAKVILPEPLERLDGVLKGPDWSRAEPAYRALIDGCNRCHAATGHEYIKILPAHGAPPWNQDFAP